MGMMRVPKLAGWGPMNGLRRDGEGQKERESKRDGVEASIERKEREE